MDQTCIEFQVQIMRCTTFHVLSDPAIRLILTKRHDGKRDIVWEWHHPKWICHTFRVQCLGVNWRKMGCQMSRIVGTSFQPTGTWYSEDFDLERKSVFKLSFSIWFVRLNFLQLNCQLLSQMPNQLWIDNELVLY